MKFIIYLYISYLILQISSINISFKKNSTTVNNKKLPNSYKDINIKKASFLKIDEKSLTPNEFDELSMFTDVNNIETLNSNDMNSSNAINNSFKEKITDDDITDLLEGDMIKNRKSDGKEISKDSIISKKSISNVEKTTNQKP